MAKNLSDYGVTTPNMSTATGKLQQGINLRQLLENAVPAAGEAAAIGQQMQQVQAQPTPSLADLLKSPGGLALALGTLGVGAAGGGAEGAAAFGLGALGQVQAQKAAEEQAKADAIEKLQKQRDDAQKRTDETIQRVSTVFNTNPDAFIDPETGEPVLAPEEIGLLATGVEGLKLFPQTRRKMQEATEDRKRVLEFIQEKIALSDSLEDTRGLLKTFFELQGGLIDDVDTDRLARAIGTDGWTEEMIRLIGTKSSNASDIFAYASSKGLDLEHPDVITRVAWLKPGEDTGPLTEAELKASLIVRYNEWSRDPKNSATIASIEDEATSAEEATKLKIQAAFPKEEGSKEQLEKMFSVDPNEWEKLQDQVDRTMRATKLAQQLLQFRNTAQFRDMDQEEFDRWMIRQSIAGVRAQDEEIRKAEAIGVAVQQNALIARIKQELRLFPADAEEMAKQILNEATEEARDETGRIPKLAFEQAVKRIADQRIKEASE